MARAGETDASRQTQTTEDAMAETEPTPYEHREKQ